MAIAYFASLAEAEIVEVVFVTPQGAERAVRLLVDSGFTGQSCFVLPEDADDLAHASASASQVTGALHGVQRRVAVSCRIAALSFQTTAIAILADTSMLALPPGIEGIVGLRFLRHFRRWGAEQSADGVWLFFLATDSE